MARAALAPALGACFSARLLVAAPPIWSIPCGIRPVCNLRPVVATVIDAAAVATEN
ncbi:hypothetical protein [Croceicoccus sp. BE223]|uniref:hypothetical protein n=1 Tax=Croceicoccus sp. BE223 TaxID=2817716 RepID=UPI0028551988|nr:hypothetical protein [Croceicoccus sp. BE223]MDR7101813.1 hypothetical protein [Croceicoccus sp. BE223]